MTVEELRKEAAKLGYTIAKKREYEKLAVCSTCGSKKIGRCFSDNRTQFYYCKNCGKKAEKVHHNYQARKAWNEANS